MWNDLTRTKKTTYEVKNKIEVHIKAKRNMPQKKKNSILAFRYYKNIKQKTMTKLTDIRSWS